MRISVKGKYAFSAMLYMATRQNLDTPITVINIAKNLGISKIYLEQVFSLLKAKELISSIKGSQGGYKLTKNPKEITSFDILSTIEVSLFQPTGEEVSKHMPNIDNVINKMIFSELDKSIKEILGRITLKDLVLYFYENYSDEVYMYYI